MKMPTVWCRARYVHMSQRMSAIDFGDSLTFSLVIIREKSSLTVFVCSIPFSLARIAEGLSIFRPVPYRANFSMELIWLGISSERLRASSHISSCCSLISPSEFSVWQWAFTFELHLLKCQTDVSYYQQGLGESVSQSAWVWVSLEIAD